MLGKLNEAQKEVENNDCVVLKSKSKCKLKVKKK